MYTIQVSLIYFMYYEFLRSFLSFQFRFVLFHPLQLNIDNHPSILVPKSVTKRTKSLKKKKLPKKPKNNEAQSSTSSHPPKPFHSSCRSSDVHRVEPRTR